MQSRILICTVGTGNVDELRASLIEPLTKSIRDGVWSKVVLLPSRLTVDNADLLQAEIKEVPIEVIPLPEAKQEENVDDSYRHFDYVLGNLVRQGFEPKSLIADFTRGTKAMSAALVLAAIRHGLPVLRYLSGGQRDQRGMVVAGTEIVTEVKTLNVTANRVLDDARMLMKNGSFAASSQLIICSGYLDWPDEVRKGGESLDRLARFFSAWDRLDYTSAATITRTEGFPTCGNEVRWSNFVPTRAVLERIDALAQPLPESNAAKAHPLRLLLIDLFANGERRLMAHQYEDALLRAYRVLELIGQVRLFDRGYDSAALPADDETIQQFQDYLRKKKSEVLSSSGKDGSLQAPREKVARLLKFMGDGLGQQLIDVAHGGAIKASARNYSVLIHGYDAVAGSDSKPLSQLYEKIRTLIECDLGRVVAEEHLKLARFPWPIGRGKEVSIVDSRIENPKR